MTAPALKRYIQGESEVSADNLNTFQQACDSFTQLRAFIGLPGIKVQVSGAATPNDGLGGSFYWSPNATAADNNTTIIAPTGAATGRWLRLSYFTSSPITSPSIVNVRDFGALGDGTTNDAPAIQDAFDFLNSLGGGVCFFPSGTYSCAATLTIYSKIQALGEGEYLSIIQAAPGLNADLMRSVNYATLLGTNTYLTTAGVPYGFALTLIQLDGNGPSQASGNCLSVYAKHYYLDRVIIRRAKDVGWYSEAWYNVNTALYPEEPESPYRTVYVEACGSHGIQYRGPSDAQWDGIYSFENAGWGLLLETSIGVYQASCDINFAHIYANVAGGVSISANAPIRFGQLITESNFGQGLLCAGSSCQFGMLQSYINARTTGSYAVEIVGDSNVITSLNHADGGQDIGGVLVRGTNNEIGNAVIYGDSATTIGLLIHGGGHVINAYVNGYLGVGGIGVQLGTGGVTNANGCRLNLTAFNNRTNVTINTAGARNLIALNMFANAGQVNVSGSFGAEEIVSRTSFDTDTAVSETTLTAKELRAKGDQGGLAGQTSITNGANVAANSSGVGTILFKGATNRDSAGFIKIYIGTTAYYVPVFTAITG